MVNSVSWKNNNNTYERKQDFKIVSSVRKIPQRVLQLQRLEVWLCALNNWSIYLIQSLTLPLFMNRFAVF